MSLLYFRNIDEISDEPVSDTHPLPVEVIGHTAQIDTPLDWAGFESITVSSTALGLTVATASLYTDAKITVESDEVRFRLDGVSPTATVGHKLAIGDVLTLRGRRELDKVRFIRTSTDATLRVSYGNVVL